MSLPPCDGHVLRILILLLLLLLPPSASITSRMIGCYSTIVAGTIISRDLSRLPPASCMLTFTLELHCMRRIFNHYNWMRGASSVSSARGSSLVLVIFPFWSLSALSLPGPWSSSRSLVKGIKIASLATASSPAMAVAVARDDVGPSAELVRRLWWLPVASCGCRTGTMSAGTGLI